MVGSAATAANEAGSNPNTTQEAAEPRVTDTAAPSAPETDGWEVPPSGRERRRRPRQGAGQPPAVQSAPKPLPSSGETPLAKAPRVGLQEDEGGPLALMLAASPAIRMADNPYECLEQEDPGHAIMEED